MSKASDDVLAERQRQISVEGWTPEHDSDDHQDGELALAAAYYAAPCEIRAEFIIPCGCREAACPHATFGVGTKWRRAWPFDTEPKRKTRRQDLVRAGALILAEIERLDRQEATTL